MTEEQIERKVEHAMDVLDARFLRGELTQETYDREVKALNDWADNRYIRSTWPKR